ncbi:MAG: hypothetical protein AAGF20_06715, partial [Pseudomonadota bacterium]
LFPGFENSTSLEELALTVTDVDAATISFDDARYSGGAPRLYVAQNGVIGTLTGQNLVAEWGTGEFEINPGRKTRVRAVWPDTDAVNGITVTLRQQQRRGDVGQTKSGSNLQKSGRIPLQSNGRYFNMTLKIDDPDWTYAQSVEFEQSMGALR